MVGWWFVFRGFRFWFVFGFSLSLLLLLPLLFLLLFFSFSLLLLLILFSFLSFCLCAFFSLFFLGWGVGVAGGVVPDQLNMSPANCCVRLFFQDKITATRFWRAVQSNLCVNSKRYRRVLIFRASRSAHVTPMLRSFHWLPTEPRIQCKLFLFCFKFISDQAPLYFSDFLHLYTPSWHLRSSADNRVFRMPPFRTKSSGQRSFSYQAPTTCNQRPVSFRHDTSVISFKPSLC